ncbi:MAG TPA: hypothetical protein VMD91_07570 [Candidatus Sulfotelmatobacter sp.]|nr:hypothetical protein [Candidatus Sulfotelmatobacter sp.]
MKTRFGMASVLFSAGLLLGGSVTGVALARQPHMYAARTDLRSALGELQAADPDKAGHRVNAMNLVNQAIGEVNAGIAAGRM